MIKLTKSHYIDTDKFTKDLSVLGFVFVDSSVLDNYVRFATQEYRSLMYLCSQIMATDSGYRVVNSGTRGNVFRYLTEVKNCPEGIFYIKGRNDWSLDAKKVLKKLYDRGFAPEFLENYILLNSKKSVLSSISSMSTKVGPSDKKSADGNPLSILPFKLTPLTPNLRVYYHSHNIQGIPDAGKHCLVAPEGYVIVSGDFAQSDFRIAYNMLLRDKDNKNIMESIEDKYHAFFKLIMGAEYNEQEFLDNRTIYKTNTLGPIYGAKSGNTEKEQDYISRINRYLSTNKIYSEYKRRIGEKIDLGVPLNITSYFGNTQLITEATVSNGFEKPKNINKAMLDYALNAPVQTGTAEIVIAITNSIMEHFAEVGFTSENGGIYSYINRHDEPVFLVSLEALQHSSIFQKHESVIVDDWMPLNLDFSYTDAYNTVNESIQRYAKRFYIEEDAYDNYTVSRAEEDNHFIPIGDIFKLAVGLFDMPNGQRIISFYNYVTQQCSFQLQTDLNDDTTIEIISHKLVNNKGTLERLDCDVVSVYTQLVVKDEKIFNSGLLTCMTNNYPSGLNTKASLLAEHMALKYCNSKDIELTPSYNHDVNIQFIESVIDNGELFS